VESPQPAPYLGLEDGEQLEAPEQGQLQNVQDDLKQITQQEQQESLPYNKSEYVTHSNTQDLKQITQQEQQESLPYNKSECVTHSNTQEKNVTQGQKQPEKTEPEKTDTHIQIDLQQEPQEELCVCSLELKDEQQEILVIEFV